MAAAAHGNVQIFNMLTDLTGKLDSFSCNLKPDSSMHTYES